jgi:hypothetical protein
LESGSDGHPARIDNDVKELPMPAESPIRSVISPGRYVQGPGAIARLGEFLAPIGSAPLIVADDAVWGFVGHDVTLSLKTVGLPITRETFRGVPSAKEINRLVEVIKSANADGQSIRVSRRYPVGHGTHGRFNGRADLGLVRGLHRRWCI